jgi:hypothetical protein
MRKLRWLTVIQNTVATGKFGNRNMRLSGLRPPPLGGVVALDWRQKIIKETVPSSKHIHQPEEEDQGLTDGPHTKADLTVVESNLEHLPPVEDYQIVLAIFAVLTIWVERPPSAAVPRQPISLSFSTQLQYHQTTTNIDAVYIIVSASASSI